MMKYVSDIGDKFIVDLKGSRHHGKTGVVIDRLMGFCGCFVIMYDGPAKEKSTMNYRYLLSAA